MATTNYIKKICEDVYINEGHYLIHEEVKKCLIDIYIKDIGDSDEILFKGRL